MDDLVNGESKFGQCEFYLIKTCLWMAGVREAELAVGLIDRIVECWQLVCFCYFDGETLEVFSSVVRGGDVEELLSDVEVEAFAARKEDLICSRLKFKLCDRRSAIKSSSVEVGGRVEIKDVISEGWGVEASVALEGVTGFEVEEAVVTLRAAERLELLWEVFGIDVSF